MSRYNPSLPWQHGQGFGERQGWSEPRSPDPGRHGHHHGHAHHHGPVEHGTPDRGTPYHGPAEHGAPDYGALEHGAPQRGAPVHAAAVHDTGHHPGSPSHDPAPASHGLGPDWAHLLDHPGAWGGPVAVMPVDHLTINNNSLIENHITETNSIVLNAAPGGDIDIGGSVNALSVQHAEVQSVSSAHGFGGDLGWGDSAWGDAGGFDAVLVGHLAGAGGGPGPIVIMPVDHLTINNNTLVQNFQVENTNITFNAGTGGTIDVDGGVNALSDQTGHFGHDQHAPDAHALLA